MTQEIILQGFETLIHNLSIDLRYENGDFTGGLCKIKKKNVLIINTNLSIEKKINVIADELKRLNLEQIYIRPMLRQIINKKF